MALLAARGKKRCFVTRQEGNESAGDLSSTEPYQRDSFAQFLFYWARHSFGSWVELPLYAVRQQRYGWAPFSSC